MGEEININLGQAGCNIGLELWNLLAFEHSISEGKLLEGKEETNLNYCFQEGENKTYHSRAVFLDSDYETIDKIRKTSNNHLFYPNSLISGKEDCSSVFFKGRYTTGQDLEEDSINAIRKQAELCDQLNNFNLVHSIAGGTGSGLTSLVQEVLQIDYHRVNITNHVLFPSQNYSSFSTEPYNIILSIPFLVDDSSLVFLYDNETIYDTITNQLNIKYPSLKDVNQIISSNIADISSPTRFKNSESLNTESLVTNLVPHPRLHFLTSSISPIYSIEQKNHQKQEEHPINSLLQQCYQKNNLFSALPQHGKDISLVSLFKGKNITSGDIHNAKQNLFQNISQEAFIDETRNPILKTSKINIKPTYLSSTIIPKRKNTCNLIRNSSSIVEPFGRMACKYDALYTKRAFYTWFIGEGGYSGEFTEAREDLSSLIEDYLSVTAKDESESGDSDF